MPQVGQRVQFANDAPVANRLRGKEAVIARYDEGADVVTVLAGISYYDVPVGLVDGSAPAESQDGEDAPSFNASRSAMLRPAPGDAAPAANAADAAVDAGEEPNGSAKK